MRLAFSHADHVPLPRKVGQSVSVERVSLSIDAVHYVRTVNFSLGHKRASNQVKLRPKFSPLYPE